MTVPAVTAVVARIASIQTRFAPQGFAGALQRAQLAGAAGQAPAAAGGAPGVPAPAAAGRPAPPQATWGAAAPAGRAPAPARELWAPRRLDASDGAQSAGGGWTQRLPEAGRPWAEAVAGAAAGAGIDPALLAAVVWAESAFDAGAVSSAGARGLAQLMPGTARGLGVDIDDPAANLAGGARYLREQLDRFGSLDLALAAYNAGPARVAQAGGVPAIAETRAYVPRVLDLYARLQGTP